MFARRATEPHPGTVTADCVSVLP